MLLETLIDPKMLKKALVACLKRPLSELCWLIGSTGQANTAKRDEIDDMPYGLTR